MDLTESKYSMKEVYPNYDCSMNSESVSSLQFEKKVNSRSYSSQFTLNDQILVAVNRREEYRPIENKITIEVDISLGICDDEESANKQYIVRLHDMVSGNPWVLRMINYDTFEDKDISNSIRDDAMEPNKLYLLQKKRTVKTDDKISFNEPPKRKLRSTASQFNEPCDNLLDKDKTRDILRNELLIHTGEPPNHYINDQTYTSYIDIDLTKVIKEDVNDSPLEIKVSNVTDIVIPILQKEKLEEPVCELVSNDKTDRKLFEQQLITPILVKNDGDVNEKSKPHDEVDCIPFAEETEDENSSRHKERKTLSKSLQYYLPPVKPKDESFDLHSDVSTGIESSTETDSVDGCFEKLPIPGKEHNFIACLDEFNDLSQDDEPVSLKNFCDEVDNISMAVEDVENKESISFVYDEPNGFDDIICQENMVLQVNSTRENDVMELNLSEFRKEKVDLLKGISMTPKLKSIPSNVDTTDDFLPVSVRRKQYEGSNPFLSSLAFLPKPQSQKVKLITSNNYTDIVDIERSIKEETMIIENKDHELDKESSISYSSGSMIVKDVLSDENFEYFITHNNLEAATPERSIEGDPNEMHNSLAQLIEEEDINSDVPESLKMSLVDKAPENFEDESGTLDDEYETDATSASSFTTSMDIENLVLKDLVKTPIECIPGQFEKFLVERERRMSELTKPNLEVDHVSSSSFSILDSNSEEDDVNEKPLATDRDEILSHHQPTLIRLPSVPKDRNSPLTSVSSPSSNSSSDSESDEFEDTNRLVEDEKQEDILDDASQRLSSIYADDLIQKEEKMIVSKDSIEMAIHDHKDSENSSSDWTSSSTEDDHEDTETNSKVMYEPLIDENVTTKVLPIESSEDKFKKFPEERENKTPIETSDSEDSSSSSSDYQQSPNKIILRHGDSIEDIEELLMQQKPSLHSQRIVPFRKQISLPNKSQTPEFGRFQTVSLDLPDKDKIKLKDGDKREDFLYSSNSSNTISSSSEEDEYVNVKNVLTDRVENKEQSTPRSSAEYQQIPNERKEAELKYHTTSRHNLSSSSEDDHDQINNNTIDHREKFDDLHKRNVIENKKKSLDGKLCSDTLLSYSDEENESSKDEKSVSRNSSNKETNNEGLECVGNVKEDQKKFNNDKKVEYSSSGSDTQSSSSDNESGNGKKESIHSKLKLDNQIEMNIAKRSDSRHSSSSSCTLSSSSEEEHNNTRKKSVEHQDVPDHYKRNSTPQIIDKLPSVTSNAPSVTSHESLVEEKERAKDRSIDHQEKFDPSKVNSTIIGGRRKHHNDNEWVHEHSSSDSDTTSSSSDKELSHTKSESVDNEQWIGSEPTNLSVCSPKNKSIDRREKFDNVPRVNTIESQRQSNKDKESAPRHSFTGSDSLSSSSDEESIETNTPNPVDNSAKNKSIDRREKFDNFKRGNTIDSQRKYTNEEEPVHIHSSDESAALSICPVEGVLYSTEKNKSMDHVEKFEDNKLNSTLKKPGKVKRSIDSSSDTDTFSSSSDGESTNSKKKSIDHREGFEDSKRNGTTDGDIKIIYVNEYIHKDVIEAEEKNEENFEPIYVNLTGSSPKNKSIDRREKFDNFPRANTIEGQKMSKNGEKPFSRDSYSDNSSADSDTSSSYQHTLSDEGSGTDNVDYQSIDHREKLEDGPTGHTIKSQRKLLKNKDSIAKPPFVSSSAPLIIEQEDERKDLKYQTLPLKLRQKDILIKDKCKSLDKSLEINTKMTNGDSTLDMVERKYHEYTETWSSHSNIDNIDIRRTSQSNVKKAPVKKSNDVQGKRRVGPLTNRPRPVPSYMSPVNSFPYVPSDREFSSNDSIGTEYSSDRRVEEILTRNKSLPDFVRELSFNKLYKAPPPPPPIKQIIPKQPAKPTMSPRIVDLNYGAEEDKVDFSKEKSVRRTSTNSVTTDSSYLDKPILAEKSPKSKLAKLDSLTSLTNSTSTVHSNEAPNRNSKSKSSVSKTSSTSASSMDSDSETDSAHKLTPPAPLHKSRQATNQVYKERSQLINESNIYPVKSNNVMRQKIPSTSESSEYSSGSDEESSS